MKNLISFAGPIEMVSQDRITPLDASLGDVSLVMTHMGLGAGKLPYFKSNTRQDEHTVLFLRSEKRFLAIQTYASASEEKNLQWSDDNLDKTERGISC